MTDLPKQMKSVARMCKGGPLDGEELWMGELWNQFDHFEKREDGDFDVYVYDLEDGVFVMKRKEVDRDG